MPIKRTKSRGRKSKSPAKRKKRFQRKKSFKRTKTFKPRRSTAAVTVCRAGTVGAGNSSTNSLGNSRPKHQPRWWLDLLRMNTPCIFTGQHGRAFANSVQNLKTPVTFWLCRGIYDIQAALNFYSTNSSATSLANNFKNYMFDYTREQHWRNGGLGAVDLEFYAMYPRERLPLASTILNTGVIRSFPKIAPVGTNQYDGDYYIEPEMYVQGLYDIDSIPSGGSAKVTAWDQSATPYMVHALTSLFKIKPLVMTWPNGQSGNKGRLEPGQELVLKTSVSRPLNVSYAKFGLDGQDTYAMQNTWQLLRETPLIFMYWRGSPAHEALTGLGPVQPCVGKIDWVSFQRFKFFQTQIGQTTSNAYTTPPIALATPTQIAAVTGQPVSV